MGSILNFRFLCVTIYLVLQFSYTVQTEYGDSTPDKREEGIYMKFDRDESKRIDGNVPAEEDPFQRMIDEEKSYPSSYMRSSERDDGRVSNPGNRREREDMREVYGAPPREPDDEDMSMMRIVYGPPPRELDDEDMSIKEEVDGPPSGKRFHVDLSRMAVVYAPPEFMRRIPVEPSGREEGYDPDGKGADENRPRRTEDEDFEELLRSDVVETADLPDYEKEEFTGLGYPVPPGEKTEKTDYGAELMGEVYAPPEYFFGMKTIPTNEVLRDKKPFDIKNARYCLFCGTPCGPEEHTCGQCGQPLLRREDMKFKRLLLRKWNSMAKLGICPGCYLMIPNSSKYCPYCGEATSDS